MFGLFLTINSLLSRKMEYILLMVLLFRSNLCDRQAQSKYRECTHRLSLVCFLPCIDKTAILITVGIENYIQSCIIRINRQVVSNLLGYPECIKFFLSQLLSKCLYCFRLFILKKFITENLQSQLVSLHRPNKK